MIGRVCGLFAFLLLAGCGGGGSGGGSAGGAGVPASVPVPATLTNTAAIVVDGGPAILSMGSGAYITSNVAFVSVTLCAPGTTTCQTVDHVQVDTGSVGLRIFQSVLTPALQAALPHQTDANAAPVGECYQFVDGYAFGSVRQADFKIGGEAVADMPVQLIADADVFATSAPGW